MSEKNYSTHILDHAMQIARKFASLNDKINSFIDDGEFENQPWQLALVNRVKLEKLSCVRRIIRAVIHNFGDPHILVEVANSGWFFSRHLQVSANGKFILARPNTKAEVTFYYPELPEMTQVDSVDHKPLLDNKKTLKEVRIALYMALVGSSSHIPIYQSPYKLRSIHPLEDDRHRKDYEVLRLALTDDKLENGLSVEQVSRIYSNGNRTFNPHDRTSIIWDHE